MGERLAALAALSRIRAIAEQIPVQALSAPAVPETIPEQAANTVAVSRPLQEIAGLRQMAETTSQGITPNTNGQRADALGSVLSRQAESTVAALEAPEPRRAVADVVEMDTRGRLSFNRAILEVLRGGFETAQATVPTVEQQREAIREALAVQRSEGLARRTGEERAPVQVQNLRPVRINAEADALGVLAGAPGVSLSRPRQVPYPSAGQGPNGVGGSRLNFLV